MLIQIQTVIAIVGICASAGIALAVAAVQYCQGKQPSFLPFTLFKAICRFNTPVSVDELKESAPGVFLYSYGDERYRRWRDVLIRRNRITAMEWMALDTQMHEEQDRGRMEQTRVHLNALSRKQLELKNQGSNSDL